MENVGTARDRGYVEQVSPEADLELVGLGRPAIGIRRERPPGNWAPVSRPVRAAGGVYTGRRYEVVREGRSAGW
jgi:hypothetical protein